MAGLTNTQKVEWARLLYTREKLTQKEIAKKVGLSEVTISKYVVKEKWEELRKSMLITREEQLRHIYNQLSELNSAIDQRDAGSRYANHKEADTIVKLTAAIRTLESEASIADTIEVSKRILNWLRAVNPLKAEEMAAIIDDYIKEQLKRTA